MTLILDKEHPLGTKVQTRDGGRARLLCIDVLGSEPVVAAVIFRDSNEEFILTYDAGGSYQVGNNDGCDLINAHSDPWVKIEDVPEEWKTKDKVQGFPDIFGRVTVCRFFGGDNWRDIEGDCMQPTHLSPLLEPPEKIEITFKEGEGL